MLHRVGVNVRLMLFLAAVSLPFLWYGYVLADELIYHGIKPHAGYTEVDLRTLGCFPFDPERDSIQAVPARFRALDGKRVILQGVMVADDNSASQVDHFQFVYNKQLCCLGGPPKVQERVFGRCLDGGHVKYYDNEPVQMVGILHANLEHDVAGGVVTAVYEIDVESVEPL